MGNEENEIRECQSSAEAQRRADYYQTILNTKGGPKDDLIGCVDDDFGAGFDIHDGLMYKSLSKWLARAEELRRQGK